MDSSHSRVSAGSASSILEVSNILQRSPVRRERAGRAGLAVMICPARPASMRAAPKTRAIGARAARRMRPRNDPFRPDQGQGNYRHGMKSLPPELKIDVTAKPFALTDADARARRRRGPAAGAHRHARQGTSRKLPQRRALAGPAAGSSASGSEAPILVARLPNRRHTLAVVGFVKQGASGFERLELAGKLAARS